MYHSTLHGLVLLSGLTFTCHGYLTSITFYATSTAEITLYIIQWQEQSKRAFIKYVIQYHISTIGVQDINLIENYISVDKYDFIGISATVIDSFPIAFGKEQMYGMVASDMYETIILERDFNASEGGDVLNIDEDAERVYAVLALYINITPIGETILKGM